MDFDPYFENLLNVASLVFQLHPGEHPDLHLYIFLNSKHYEVSKDEKNNDLNTYNIDIIPLYETCK